MRERAIDEGEGGLAEHADVGLERLEQGFPTAMGVERPVRTLAQFQLPHAMPALTADRLQDGDVPALLPHAGFHRVRACQRQVDGFRHGEPACRHFQEIGLAQVPAEDSGVVDEPGAAFVQSVDPGREALWVSVIIPAAKRQHQIRCREGLNRGVGPDSLLRLRAKAKQ